MSEFKVENILLEGVSGSLILNEFDLIFTGPDASYKWSISNWIKSEKSKKSQKVRLTFKEPSIKLTSGISESDLLVKSVIVLDFVEDRVKLDEFCDLVTDSFEKSRKTVHEPRPSQVTTTPTSAPSETDTTDETKIVSDEFDLAKRNLLNSDNNMSRLYNNLVSPSSEYHGLIMPKDFWDHHKSQLTAKADQPKARSNLDGFVSVPPSSTVVNSQNVFNYTKELGEALLVEDETIRDLYNKLVVEKKFPEENFWKRILQSHYFYNLIGEKIPENRILYDDIKGIKIKKVKKKLDAKEILKMADPSSEVITLEDWKKTNRNSKYFNVKRIFESDVNPDEQKHVLVGRFNDHSLSIIRESQSNSKALFGDCSNTQSSSESLAEEYRKRKLLELNHQDLEEKEEEYDSLCVIASLKMPGTPEDQSQNMVKPESEGAKKIQLKLSHSVSLTEQEQWIQELKDFDIVKYIKDCKYDDKVSKKMFVVNTKLCQSEKLIHSPQFEYDPNTVKVMKGIQQEIIEVLQMYYKTLIPEEEKRAKLLAILRIIKHKIESLNEAGISSHTVKALQSSLLDQITAAEAYDLRLRTYLANLRSQRSR